jgi:hypothetical protein
MIRKVCSGFPKRPCSIEKLKRDDDLAKSHRASETKPSHGAIDPSVKLPSIMNVAG